MAEWGLEPCSPESLSITLSTTHHTENPNFQQGVINAPEALQEIRLLSPEMVTHHGSERRGGEVLKRPSKKASIYGATHRDHTWPQKWVRWTRAQYGPRWNFKVAASRTSLSLSLSPLQGFCTEPVCVLMWLSLSFIPVF